MVCRGSEIPVFYLFFWPLISKASTMSIVSPGEFQMKSVTVMGLECRGTFIERVVTNYSGYIYSHHPFDGKPYPPPKLDTNCVILFKAPVNYQIELRMMQFYLDGIPRGPRTCSGDSLHIFDYPEQVTSIQPNTGELALQFCGLRQNGSIISQPMFTSSNNALSLWLYLQGRESTVNKEQLQRSHQHKANGFQLMWTIFRDPKGQTCFTNEFQCLNGHCIPLVLACDNQAHCSDASDTRVELQRDAGCTNIPESSASIATIVCIIVGIALAFALICVVMYYCRSRSRSLIPSKSSQSNHGQIDGSLGHCAKNRRPCCDAWSETQSASPLQISAPVQITPRHC